MSSASQGRKGQCHVFCNFKFYGKDDFRQISADQTCREAWSCEINDGVLFNPVIIHLSIASPPETTGDLTASLCPGVGNLTTRWVTGVGHIDRRQSALWSPRVQGGAIWPFRVSPGGDLGYIWPPPWSNPHHLPGGGGGGGTLGHAIDRCISSRDRLNTICWEDYQACIVKNASSFHGAEDQSIRQGVAHRQLAVLKRSKTPWLTLVLTMLFLCMRSVFTRRKISTVWSSLTRSMAMLIAQNTPVRPQPFLKKKTRRSRQNGVEIGNSFETAKISKPS